MKTVKVTPFGWKKQNAHTVAQVLKNTHCGCSRYTLTPVCTPRLVSLKSAERLILFKTVSLATLVQKMPKLVVSKMGTWCVSLTTVVNCWLVR